MNDVSYNVIDRRFGGPGKCWYYDLAETDGDRELNDVNEQVLDLLASPSHYVYEDVMKKLDEIRSHLNHLGETIDEELNHIEAMQNCRTFDVAAKDLAQAHSRVGHMNSVRCWVENAVFKATEVLEGEDEETEKEA